MAYTQLHFDITMHGEFETQFPIRLEELSIGDKLTITGFDSGKRVRTFAHEFLEELASDANKDGTTERGYNHELNEQELTYTITRQS